MPDYIDLYSQIPLVGIFVAFVLVAGKLLADWLDKRDAQWREFLDDMQKSRDLSVDRLGKQVGLNTAIMLLLYRKDGNGDPTTKRLIDEVMDEYRSS